MKALLLRSMPSRRIVTALILATVLANVLALVSSVYSIHVMNRYLGNGVDATLLTLTIGAVIAIVAEYLLRSARLKVAEAVLGKNEADVTGSAFTTFASARLQTLEQLPAPQRREALGGLTSIQQFLTAGNLATVLDAPFALLFLAVLALLSPTLALISTIAIATLCTVIIFGQRSIREPTAQLSKLSARSGSLTNFLATSGETVRAFNCYDHLQRQWHESTGAVARVRQWLHARQNSIQQIGQSGGTVLSVAVYAIGAREVVHGHLDTGGLIGASILSARALAAVTRLAHLTEGFERARQALHHLSQLGRLPTEKQKGIVPVDIAGEIDIGDVALSYAGRPTPLFESVNAKVRAGGVLAVVGGNGSGKSSLLRLLAGLTEPDRGHIRVDNTDLRHVVPEWWRKQIIYLPQEPQFFDGTLKENLKVLSPQLADDALIDLCRSLDLAGFLNQSTEGLDMQIRNGGASLPVGVRRRLALVRALAGGGRIAILDEPTEGVDARGCQAIAQTLNNLVKRGCTVFVATREDFIIKAAEAVLDLNVKPVPQLVTARPEARKGHLGAVA